MAVLNFTTREFREKQPLVLNKVDTGEEVIIHRGKDKSYMLTPIHNSDLVVSDEFKKKIAQAREDYRKGKGITCKTFEDSIALFETL